MSAIVLATINARYIHPSLGLRCIYANMGELHSQTRLIEFNFEHPVPEIAQAILDSSPRIIGIGVYIWNVRLIQELARELKQRAPGTRLVLGGPEVSHDLGAGLLESFSSADHFIQGEADVAFAELCRTILAGGSAPRIIQAALPDLAALQSPYPFYTDGDLKTRMQYVEVSRGCPFTCEFCLSSLDSKVRSFPLTPFLADMEGLLARGARKFKFVDRTFNLSERLWRPVLEFFLQRIDLHPFLHFEIVPDRLPSGLVELISRFPEGTVQFEVGIQSFNREVCERIRRRQDFVATERNLRLLREQTRVHLHADLIVGLPGESIDSFAIGFDHLVALAPHEIQMGILKKLRGAPIARHDAAFHMEYSEAAPYEILSNDQLDAATLTRLKRFAAYWERYYNVGCFARGLGLLFRDNGAGAMASPFYSFLSFSDWLHARHPLTHSLAMDDRYLHLLNYLIQLRGYPEDEARPALLADYHSVPGRRTPRFLKD